jgi:hypothetical protein
MKGWLNMKGQDMTDILKHLHLIDEEIPKNINNNYKQLQTLQTTTNILQTPILMGSVEPQEDGSNTTELPLGKATPSNDIGQIQVVENKPAAWRGVKYDLYHRGFLKDGRPNMQLNTAIIRSIDGAKMHLKAVLNQKWSSGFMSKNCDDWKTNPYWIKCRAHYKHVNSLYSDVRVSKCIEPNRAGTWMLTVFVFQVDGVWRVDMLADSKIYTVHLTGDLTDKQTKTNCIATRYFGQTKTQLKDPKQEGWL